MSTLKIRLTTENDYTELYDWWLWHRWSKPPSKELLDNLKFGIIISHNNENVCAGFIYFTNARAFGILEYIISSYKIKDKTIRKEALELLIITLMDIATKKNVKTLFTFVKHESLVNRLKHCGFVVTSDNYKGMIVNL